MPVSEKTRRALEGLGLTGYEIKTYVSLIEYGTMTAAEVSRQSRVPYSKIYEVLSGLEEKGWIEADRSRPSRFYPKPPSTAIETMKMKSERERAENEAEVLRELMPVYERRGARERPEIWIVRGEFNILAKVKEMLQGCERELMVALPSAMNSIGVLAAPTLATLREKGVRLMLMVSEDVPREALRSAARHAEVRLRWQMFGGGAIADGRQVILLLGAEGGGSSHLAIWADHPGLAKFAKNYFEYLWNDSKGIRFK